ncbi:hypothetical protein ARZXY2_4698 (plasmid) [Arthrobacter sp. ZXY-2]|nr:hypothetical protein ARZXY2_4698 [Arthrobacter sp. ZXY-2]
MGWISGHHQSSSWENLARYEDMQADWMCSYIVKMYVSPSSRSQGIGQQLISRFEAATLEAGRNLIVVLPDETKELARLRRFYESCGFKLMAPSSEYSRMKPWLMAKAIVTQADSPA